MEKKICPVCEHVLSGNHYCRVCRKWIWHPKVIHANYYLNERHPAQEENCEYHHPSFMEERSSAAPAKPPARPEGQSRPQQYARQAQAQSARQVQAQSARQAQTQPARQNQAQSARQPQAQPLRQMQVRPTRQLQTQSAWQNQDGKNPLPSALIVIFVAVFLLILLSAMIPVFLFFI